MDRREVLIKGGYGESFKIYEGEYLKVIDVNGKQVADFIAFNLLNDHEYVSTAHTRTMNNNISIKQGSILYSNYRNPMFSVVEDTVGVHDTLYPCCDPKRYLLDFNVKEHRSCRDNFAQKLKSYNIEYWRIPDPINLFQNAPINNNGEFSEVNEPISKAGDYIVFKALKDLIVGVSACPMDLTPLCGWDISDILIEISDTY